jgi:prefoldin subunit 5
MSEKENPTVSDIATLEAKVAEIDNNVVQIAMFIDKLAKEHMAATKLLQRTEHFLFSLIKVGLDSGLDFNAMQDAMEDYNKHEDLLVFWGVRTQEEYETLKAQSQAAQEAAQVLADGQAASMADIEAEAESV